MLLLPWSSQDKVYPKTLSLREACVWIRLLCPVQETVHESVSCRPWLFRQLTMHVPYCCGSVHSVEDISPQNWKIQLTGCIICWLFCRLRYLILKELTRIYIYRLGMQHNELPSIWVELCYLFIPSGNNPSSVGWERSMIVVIYSVHYLFLFTWRHYPPVPCSSIFTLIEATAIGPCFPLASHWYVPSSILWE